MIAALLALLLAIPYDPPCTSIPAGYDGQGWTMTLNFMGSESGWTLWSDRPAVGVSITSGSDRPVIDVINRDHSITIAPYGQVVTRAFEPYTAFLCAPQAALTRVYLPLVTR